MRPARSATLIIPLVLTLAACSGSASPVPTTGIGPTAAPPAAASAAPPAAASPAPPAAASPASGSAVSIADFSFQPAALTVPVGSTVTWTNNDSADHTVTADDGSFTSDMLGKGATFAHTFATAGTFAYHCRIHPSMTAVVTVQ